MRKLAFLLPFLVVPSLALAADQVVEDIVARVNNQIITRTEYQRTKDQLHQEVEQQDPTHAKEVIVDREKDVLRDLIDQQLLLERGKDLDINADTEVIKRLDQMRKEMKLDSMEDLEKAAQAQGVSFEDFKQNIRNQIITQQVIGREVGSHLAITKEEEQKFYQDHKKDMERQEQIRLSEILIPVASDGSADDAQVAAIQAKADALLAEIRKGTAFEDAAKKNSGGPTAQQGGDLGYFKRGTLAKELEDKTFAMKAGDVSDVIRTRQGFVILKVTEHQAAGIPSFEEIEPRVQDALYMQRLQPALRTYLAKLRDDAYIYLKPGYVDSGSTGKQNNPVETASKAGKTKELKKKKKFLLF